MSQPLIMQRFCLGIRRWTGTSYPSMSQRQRISLAISWDKSSLQCSSVLKATTSIGSLNWPGQKVGDYRLDVGALGLPGDAMQPRAFHDQIDRLIGAISAHSEEIRALPDLHATEILITMHGKSSS